MQLWQHVCCADTKILRIRQSHFEIHFFSMTILEKTQKYAKQNFFARLKSRYKSVLFTGIQLLIFSCFSFQGESKNLTHAKYCILYQTLLEVSPFNEHETCRNWWRYGFGAIFPYFFHITGTLTHLRMSDIHLLYTTWGLLWHMWGYIRHHWFENFQVLCRLFLCSLSNWLTWS